MTETRTVHVALAERAYDIRIGDGLIALAGDEIRPALNVPRVFVVTDENVAALHLARFEASLRRAGVEPLAIVLPPGEETKNIHGLMRLVDAALDARVERTSTLIALGGGVIGDMTGFAAAILLRGIDFIQVPTTLLAQVDSAVGGKTAIDTRHGKNLVGAFHQPRLVLADVGALATLPRREMLAGYAEVVKYGLLGNAPFFDWLETNGSAVVAGDPAALIHAVATACEDKARIVAADEREAGERALLNLGHTFGHSMEAALGYGPDLLHGEAVALGLVLAFDLSVRIGLCPADDAARVRRHLAATGLPTRARDVLGGRIGAETLIDRMGHDKKVTGGRVTFILARGIGQAFIARDVALDLVMGLLRDELAA